MANHSFGGGIKGQYGAVGQDSANDLHIINSLKKIIDMEMPMEVKFQDQTYLIVEYELAYAILMKYVVLRTSHEKEEFVNTLWESSESFQRYHLK